MIDLELLKNAEWPIKVNAKDIAPPEECKCFSCEIKQIFNPNSK